MIHASPSLLTLLNITDTTPEEIYIVGNFPASINSNARYILCTHNPELLTPQQLQQLYDVWPNPLTPSLAKFLAQRLTQRLAQETQNSQENIEHQKRILEMAQQDYLTGLATRWYLQDFIDTNSGEKYITCIYLDLDRFKQINDTFGHQEGDRALAATAEMMQNEFADGFCARLGGDEFMIVLLGKRDIEGVEWRVNGFMKRLLSYYRGVTSMKGLSVSAGISQSLPTATKTIDRLIHEADKALYQAKREGRARCKIYSSEME